MSKSTQILLLLCIAIGLGVFWWALHRAPPQPGAGQASADRKALYWYDPMVPQTHFDHPGKSPFMDMQLVPKYPDEGNTASAGTVSVDPRTLQNLGVRTAKVERSGLGQALDATGIVAIDERRIVSVEARAAGWVEKLSVRAVGDPVRRGQAVASIYSPDLYTGRGELALARQSGDPQLAAAAQERLRLLGAGSGAGPRTAVVAPAAGVVTELGVREGAQVSPGMALMKLADLSQVWIVVQVPEAQAAALRQGAAVTARLAALPGRELKGRIEYVYPTAEAGSRTLSARVGFDNADGALKPGQYASVHLDTPAGGDALSVPTEAVIRTGSGDRVIVALGEGRFEPRLVTMGGESGGRTAILSGLQEGENVVASGQFLIDSEANLQGVLARLGQDAQQMPEAPK